MTENTRDVLLMDGAANDKPNQKSKSSFHDHLPFIILALLILIFLIIIILTIILHLNYRAEIDRLNKLLEKMSRAAPQPVMIASRFGYRNRPRIIED